MITFKVYHHNPVKVSAAHYTGNMADAEFLESAYKGRVRLVFRGCFCGVIEVMNMRGYWQPVQPGDYLLDSEDFGLFSLTPELFNKYYSSPQIV